jgi:HEAT repeat protein
VALAVQHAHEAGIVHRDLKPANILVDRSGEPKVTDFGIAKDIAGGEAITKAGMTIGTPCYMAPEQAAGENDRVGPRTDVYALGAILYEALAKRPPFSSSAMSETLRRVLVEDPVPLRKVNPDVPAALEAVAARAMEKDPARRHPSALALAEDLGRFLEGKAAPPRRSWKPLLGGIAAAALLLAAAFAAFPRRGPTASIEDQLEQAVRDARGTDRKRAAAMLLELGAQGIPAWRRLLAAPDPEVRWRAAEALGDLGARQAVPDLARALHDEDQDVARRAAEALASMGSVTEIVRLLEDPSAAVRRRATRQVARLRNERTLPPLLLLLAHAEPGVRESAAATLGLLGARDAAGEIEKLLADEDTDVRQAAANALAALEARERIPALLKLLGDEDGAVRESACSALARLGAREAVPELERLRTEDPSEGVRAAAEEALRTLR